MGAISKADLRIGGHGADVIDIRAQRLRAFIRKREARARHFSSALFADPAWDILLDVALAHMTGAAPVLRVAAAMPPATLQRWLDLLADEGLTSGAPDAQRLTDQGLYTVSAWLADLNF